MQFEIQRVPADIDPEEFERSFYRTRTPVIVEGGGAGLAGHPDVGSGHAARLYRGRGVETGLLCH